MKSSFETISKNLAEIYEAVELIARREKFMKENPPVPPQFDTQREVSYEMLLAMDGLPVYDSRLGKWVIVESVYLWSTGKIHFPILPEYPFLNPLYCLKMEQS